MRHVTRVLQLVGTVAGAVVIVYGLARGLMDGAAGPLLIALAVLTVGPVEDLLNSLARRARGEPARKAWMALIDQVTSVVFLLLLAWTIALWP